jgi:ribosomal protein L24E
MSMAHIYQPLMLIELIRGNGKKYLFCNSKDIKTIKDLRKYVNSIDWHTIESILVQ